MEPPGVQFWKLHSSENGVELCLLFKLQGKDEGARANKKICGVKTRGD